MTTDIGFQTEVLVGTNIAAVTATVLLAGLKAVTPPALSRGEADITAMGEPDFLKQFIPGLTDPGELPLELNWLPDSDAEELLREMFAERQSRLIMIRFNMVTPRVTCSFRGFLRERTPTVPMEDGMTCAATFRVTSKMTWGTVA
ncbi:phage tail tube protein [Pseudotabrizicola sp. 4114]|uniref:phage tail tube protein n=1 Tax=Pseudotabrizicola sp. 4114 TaxID=2817731 RepID=UPI00285A82D4|nr:hypothetical protein [Pseudorhodobacter sp. 4114]